MIDCLKMFRDSKNPYFKSGLSDFDEYISLLESMNDPHVQVLDRLRSAIVSLNDKILFNNQELLNLILNVL